MKQGFLSKYFDGCVAKRLTAVEADTSKSNQHEFNGVTGLKKLFGEEKLLELPTCFLWVGDDQEAVAEEGFLTWYDAREQHPTRSEFRLYFPTTAVSEKARADDVLFIARRANVDGTAIVIVAPPESTVVSQLLWLFDIKDDLQRGFVADNIGDSPRELSFTVRYILDELGLEVEDTGEDYERWVEDFELVYPSTRVFSARARESLPHLDALESPDDVLLQWIEREEALFRFMEKQIVASRLRTGFQVEDGSPDVDGFIKYSLSVQNRRKSRAGYALENHLEAVFQTHGIRYDREAVTENASKPDFIFPGSDNYHDLDFPVDSLTMLGAKSSCKDRWRQVLTEAQRITAKHLLTLEPGISTMQTDEMRSKELRLVLPTKIHETYQTSQREWLMSVSDFLKLVSQRQDNAN